MQPWERVVWAIFLFTFVCVAAAGFRLKAHGDDVLDHAQVNATPETLHHILSVTSR
jgi:D-alanyl-lipoteichoic acid acyltransferase DltB (MBOAT superfamily)